MSRRISGLVMGLAATLALSACSSGMDDLEQYVAQVKARKTTQIDPIRQIKPYQAFAYVAGDRRDPFVPTQPERDKSSSSALAPDMNRNKEPLEEFPLDALKLVGVVTYKGVVMAMVKAPDSVIHRVKVGDHMGQNFGKIDKITEADVTLTEIVPDGFGGFTERPASLAAAD